MEHKALIFDIKRDCSEDGPGIRTTVFFKNCPLSCIWCQNPEGKTGEVGISFRPEACRPSECGTPCLDICPEQCIHLEGEPHVDHAACTRCDRCFEVCPKGALEPAGYWITLEQLLYRVSIDKPFYQSSNGGVTLSGGEATSQMHFINQFLKELKKEGIHTALETCGLFSLNRFRQFVLPYLDLIYFDLKFIDDEESRRYTGQSNRRILENFVSLFKEGGVPVIPRIPLIPQITATRENLVGLARFLRRHGVQTCSLMPYNPLWRGKLKRLGLTAEYRYGAFMSKTEEQECVNYFFQSQTQEERMEPGPLPR